MKFCTKCGVQNGDNSSFCSQCGNSMNADAPQANQVFQQSWQ